MKMLKLAYHKKNTGMHQVNNSSFQGRKQNKVKDSKENNASKETKAKEENRLAGEKTKRNKMEG